MTPGLISPLLHTTPASGPFAAVRYGDHDRAESYNILFKQCCFDGIQLAGILPQLQSPRPEDDGHVIF